LHDQMDYLNEKAVLLELSRAEELLPEQRAEVLLQLGNAEIRLGEFSATLAHFGEAIQISQLHKLSDKLTNAQNALGWCYRLLGQLDQAIEYYHMALRTALDTDDKWNQATLLTNLAYIHTLRRNKSVALQLCHQALEIWEQLDFKRGVGIVYGTIAAILLQFDQFEEALTYHQKALDIFEATSDLERLGRNYRSRQASLFQ